MGFEKPRWNEDQNGGYSKSYGDAGLLYYFDLDGCIKSRLLSFADGYVLCPHSDQNGDRILESVYYIENDIERIDCYDKTFMYSFTKELGESPRRNTKWVATYRKRNSRF